MSPRVMIIIGLGIGVALAVGSSSTQESQSTRAFHVVVTGSGQPILLIPGLSSTGEVWEGTVEHLRGRYQLHVLTLAGFGGPAPLGEPFLPLVADALVEYARTNQLNRPILVGHSLGGFLAFAAASQAPGVFGGVVAIDGVPFLPAFGNPAATADQQASQANQVKAMYTMLTSEQLAVQSRLALEGMITDPAHVERATTWAGRSTPQAVGTAMAEMLTTDLRNQASAIEVPVVLIGALGAIPDGMRPALRAAYEAQVAALPHATVVFAEQARHFVMLDDPSFLYETLDRFLSPMSPGARAARAAGSPPSPSYPRAWPPLARSSTLSPSDRGPVAASTARLSPPRAAPAGPRSPPTRSATRSPPACAAPGPTRPTSRTSMDAPGRKRP